MKNKLIIFLAFIGLIGLSTSCEKDEIRVYMSGDPIPPALVTIPDLTLLRANATDTIYFVGTPIDPGFVASANYYLEACVAGTNFETIIRIWAGTQDTSINVVVSTLNKLLLKTFPEFQLSDIDFRIKATLKFDAGTGAVGSIANPLEYFSSAVSASAILYGLPRMDIIDSGIEQNLSSPLGDGIYAGYILLDMANPFTLLDPETGTSYGGGAGTLTADGAAIVPGANGWHEISVNTNDLTYELDPYSVGVVGAFTEWGDLPDFPMDYDSEKGYWFITMDLPVGPMKFRLNSDWAVNWGPGALTDLPAEGGVMPLPNASSDINITFAGNYTIQVTITGTSGSANFILN